MGIGERIKALRKAVNLTQEVFAFRLRISKGFLSNLEKEVRQPSDQLVLLISHEYSSSENWLTTGEGEMFLSAEEIVKNQIARLGERTYYEALKNLLDNNGLVVLGGIRSGARHHDPDLDHMISFLNDLWVVGDENMKSWARIQFSRAFPPDVQDDVQKKRAENQSRESTA